MRRRGFIRNVLGAAAALALPLPALPFDRSLDDGFYAIRIDCGHLSLDEVYEWTKLVQRQDAVVHDDNAAGEMYEFTFDWPAQADWRLS